MAKLVIKNSGKTKMNTKLKLPLTERDVKKLRVGEIVYLSGILYTARDEAHKRMLKLVKEGKKLPFDLNGYAIFHCGPIMKREKGNWIIIAAGPTTSARMNPFSPKIIQNFGVRIIIGKGGVDKKTVDVMKDFGCSYLAFPGGAAAIATIAVSNVKGVHWLDLGMAEALWMLQMKDFGPLIVAIDVHGNSLYENTKKSVDKNLRKIKNKWKKL